MINLQQQGSALILTLNAPATRKGLNDAMVQVLREAAGPAAFAAKRPPLWAQRADRP